MITNYSINITFNNYKSEGDIAEELLQEMRIRCEEALTNKGNFQDAVNRLDVTKKMIEAFQNRTICSQREE